MEPASRRLRSLPAIAAILGGCVMSCADASTSTPAPSVGSDAEAPSSSLQITPSVSRPARPVEPAPDLALSPGDVARFAPLPERALAIPVLAFHSLCRGACSAGDAYSTPKPVFARMMAMLGAAGYRTITIDAYSRFLVGDRDGLPDKPLLLTFDDSRYDSWAGADAILDALGMHATMFVITDKPETEEDDAYMRWSEVRQAAASGRWDVQLHADTGHVRIPVGMNAGSLVLGSAYASFRFDPLAPISQRVETFEAWKSRVESDIERGEALLAANVPSYRAAAFAVPFGDIGQTSSDPRIESELRAYLDAHYAVWFVQDLEDPDFTSPYRGPSHEAARLIVGGAMTPEKLYGWLAKHASPARAPAP